MKIKSFIKRIAAIMISAMLFLGNGTIIYAIDSELPEAGNAITGNAGAPEDIVDSAALPEAAQYVPDEVLIFYEPDVTTKQDAIDTVQENNDELKETVVVTDTTAVSVIELSEDSSVGDAVEYYTSDPRIEFVMPNYIIETCEDENEGIQVQGSLNDGDYASYQWYLEQIKAEGAWNIIEKVQHNPIKVAVLDTGADIAHPDLTNVINLTDSAELLSDAPESLPGPLQGDGYEQGQIGSGTSGSTHGTHVAGILGAEANNGQGIAGAASAYDNSVLDMSVIDIFPNRQSTSSYLFKGMNYAKDHGARVINISAGVNLNLNAADSATIIEGYQKVFDSFMNAGILIVCAAGNADAGEGVYDNGNIVSLPGDLPSTISVINVDRTNQKNASSNYGSLKDISAPGTDIWSTKNGSGYVSLSGTSMSSPIVTGVVVMMLSVNPALTFTEVRDILRSTATDINQEGFDVYTGYGVVNAEKAVGEAATRAGKWEKDDVPVPTPTPTPTPTPVSASVSYKTHVQSYGWQDWVSDGNSSGTQGKAKRLEAIEIKIAAQGITGGVEYQTHVQSYGWQDWMADGKLSGTEGKAKRLEAIRVRLTGQMAEKYDIYYRVHAQTYGWLDWAKNGEPAGSSSYAKRLEAIQIKLVEKGGQAPGGTTRAYVHPLVKYQTHIQTYGWKGYVQDGAVSGTVGQGKRLEGIRISFPDPVYGGAIQYQTHIQTYGWESNWKSNGEMSGTQGKAKRLEAIKIRLTDEMAEKYDIYYQVHIQTYGWLGWAKNGEPAGSAGMAKRLEGIRIVMVPKGKTPPGDTSNPYFEK